ncbi:MAG: hypothetical protein ACYC2E_12500 [Sulfuricella sp.]
MAPLTSSEALAALNEYLTGLSSDHTHCTQLRKQRQHTAFHAHRERLPPVFCPPWRAKKENAEIPFRREINSPTRVALRKAGGSYLGFVALRAID